MFPTLFQIGSFKITTFGLMMFCSFLVAAWVLGAQLRRWGLKQDIAWDVLGWVALGGILGAKLYYLALHWPTLVADPAAELSNRGGFVWYGGLLGGVISYYWQVRRRKLPIGVLFDATAPALAIGYAIGRVGCFLVGDDYGIPTNSWVGIAFPQGSPPSTAGYLREVGAQIPENIPNAAVLAVHPTQLYEVGLALIMFAILWRLGAKRLQEPGRLFALFLALYGLERFLIEFVRAKGDRFFFGLSTSQAASLLLLGIAAYLWQRRPTAVLQPVPAAAGRKSG